MLSRLLQNSACVPMSFDRSMFEPLEARVLLSMSAPSDEFDEVSWRGAKSYAKTGEWILSLDHRAGVSRGELKTLLTELGGLTSAKHLNDDDTLLLKTSADARYDDLKFALSGIDGFEFLQ